MRTIHVIAFLLLSTASYAQSSIAELAKQAELANDPLSKYERVYSYSNGLAEAILTTEEEGSKRGIVDEEGNVYVSFIYDRIELVKEGNEYKDNLYRATINGKKGLVNSQNSTLLPCEYVYLQQKKGDIWLIGKDYKYGYIQLNGTQNVTTKIPCIYSTIKDYTEDQPIEAIYLDKKGLIDCQNNTIVPFEFDEIGNFNNQGIVWVKKNNLYGLYSKEGTLLQPCEMAEVYTLSAKGEKQPVTFEKNLTLPDSLVFIVCNERIGVMDATSGNTLIPSSYKHLTPIINGKLFYKSNGKWGIVSLENQIIQQAVYEKVVAGNESLTETHIPTQLLKANMYVSDSGLWGMLRRDGTKLIPVRYDSLGTYSENRIVAKKSGKYGYLDESGKEVIPFVHFGAADFSDELAAVQDEKGKFLFINKTGEIVIKPHSYDKVGKFVNGTCKVYRKDKVWEIDKEGKKVKDSKRDASEVDAADGAQGANADLRSSFLKGGNDEILVKGFSEKDFLNLGKQDGKALGNASSPMNENDKSSDEQSVNSSVSEEELYKMSMCMNYVDGGALNKLYAQLYTTVKKQCPKEKYMAYLWNDQWAASVKSNISSWLTHKECPLNAEEKLYVAAKALEDSDLENYEKVLNWQVNLKGWMQSWQRVAKVPMPSICDKIKAKISTHVLGFELGTGNYYEVMKSLDQRRITYIKGTAIDPSCTMVTSNVKYATETFDDAHIAYTGAGGTIGYVLFSKRINEPELSTFYNHIIKDWFDSAMVYKSLKSMDGDDVVYSDGVTDIVVQRDSRYVYVHVKKHGLAQRYF